LIGVEDCPIKTTDPVNIEGFPDFKYSEDLTDLVWRCQRATPERRPTPTEPLGLVKTYASKHSRGMDIWGNEEWIAEQETHGKPHKVGMPPPPATTDIWISSLNIQIRVWLTGTAAWVRIYPRDVRLSTVVAGTPTRSVIASLCLSRSTQWTDTGEVVVDCTSIGQFLINGAVSVCRGSMFVSPRRCGSFQYNVVVAHVN
jgi:hypothetical protein